VSDGQKTEREKKKKKKKRRVYSERNAGKAPAVRLLGTLNARNCPTH
jgi:hypothetical protein